MSVWVHTHLPRLLAGERDCLSVKVPGQRIEYASDMLLRDAEFRVHEHGRIQCLTSGQRNVHAWVVGTEVERRTGLKPIAEAPAVFRRAVYDPWKGSSFVDLETLKPVIRADVVLLSGKNVWYYAAGE